jgi:membrane-associated phospholipid phosphatase
MRAWEYIATSALMTEAFVVRFAGPDPPHDRWGLGIDEDIVEAVAITGTAEDVVRTIGHVGYIGSMAYRLVDSAFLPWIIWDSPDVAWQMSWIDLEAFAIVAGVLWNVQLVVGRERPEFRDCPDDAPDDVDCTSDSGDRWRSFIAGHVAVAATATGLTCVHHAHLPLYGGGFGDDFACGTMIGVTAAVSAARVMSERHYPSDVLLGLGLGAVAGYVVPSALHYGFGAPRARPLAADRTSRPAVTVTLAPLVAPGRLGGALVGVF